MDHSLPGMVAIPTAVLPSWNAKLAQVPPLISMYTEGQKTFSHVAQEHMDRQQPRQY